MIVFKCNNRGIMQKICDSHIHVGDFFGGIRFCPEEVASLCESQCIDKFLFFQTAADLRFLPRYEQFLRDVEKMHELLGKDKAIPALWIPFCELKNLKKYWKDEFSALKIHPAVEKALSDSNYKYAMELAADMGVPLIIHTSYDDESSCLRFAKIAEAIDNLKLVLAHGRPFEKCIKSLQISKNIFADTAYMPPEEAKKISQAGYGNQLIFGSDFPLDRFHFSSENPIARYSKFKDEMTRILPKRALSQNFNFLFVKH